MTELSPTQVALRELMILTKCYCGNYGEDPHPRLGHNCSFRPDVETVVAEVAKLQAQVANLSRETAEQDCACGHPAMCDGFWVDERIRRALQLCDDDSRRIEGLVDPLEVRSTLLGVPYRGNATEDTPPASPAREELAPFSAQLAARLQGAAQATPTEDEAGRPTTR